MSVERSTAASGNDFRFFFTSPIFAWAKITLFNKTFFFRPSKAVVVAAATAAASFFRFHHIYFLHTQQIYRVGNRSRQHLVRINVECNHIYQQFSFASSEQACLRVQFTLHSSSTSFNMGQFFYFSSSFFVSLFVLVAFLTKNVEPFSVVSTK